MKSLADTSVLVLSKFIGKKEFFVKITERILTLVCQVHQVAGMKCFFRLAQLCEVRFFLNDVQNFSKYITCIFNLIAKDSTNEKFNYYFFEALSVLISKIFNDGDASSYELFNQIVLPYFKQIIMSQNTDLLGYVYQLKAYVVYQMKKIDELDNAIAEELVVKVSNWNSQSRSFFRPMHIYLKAIIVSCPQFFEGEYLSNIFTIAYEVLRNKEVKFAFDILDCVINNINIDSIGPERFIAFFKNAIYLLGELSNFKGNAFYINYLKGLLVFCAKLTVVYSVEFLFQILDSIQPGFFKNLVAELLPAIDTVQEKKIRSIVVYGLLKILETYQKIFSIDELLELCFKTTSLQMNLAYGNRPFTKKDEEVMETETVSNKLYFIKFDVTN